MTDEMLVERVQARAGLDRTRAQAAARATLEALGAGLTRDEARAIADQLTGALGDILRHAHFAGALGEERFYQQVERGEGVDPGFAREHAQVVCQVLGEALDPETRQRLAHALPASLAALLVPAPAPPPPAVHHAPHATPGTGRTLAEGRPGSAHPLSEAQADRGQPDSLAGTDEPYADRKLSSGHAQPRSGHSLAEGKPGSDKPVSEGD